MREQGSNQIVIGILPWIFLDKQKKKISQYKNG